MSSYMGSTDDAKRDWMINLRDVLQADGAAYFVSPPAVTSISAIIDEFVAKLAVVRTVNGRNPGTTAAKNAARSQAVDACRTLAMQIKMNEGVSDALKIEAGIRPINTNRTPMPPPTEQAVITVLAAMLGSHTLRYLDPEGGESSRKPFGCTNLQINRGIAAEEIEDVAQTAFYDAFRRNPIASAFDHADDGKVATYFARWADAKGQVGPWSAPVSLRIAA
jgi:hypothetical protein